MRATRRLGFFLGLLAATSVATLFLRRRDATSVVALLLLLRTPRGALGTQDRGAAPGVIAGEPVAAPHAPGRTVVAPADQASPATATLVAHIATIAPTINFRM